MDTIKLRAWDKVNKKFHYAELSWGADWAGTGGGIDFGFFEDYHIDAHGEPPVTRFTGLKDKNGVEIYEGDVVRGYPDRGGYWTRVVEYIDHGFALSKLASFLQRGVDWTKEVEVIGNIYENPELLS